MDIWLARMVVQRCRMRLAVWASLIASAATLGLLQIDYLRACIDGPVDMNAAALGAIDVLPSSAPFVRVKGELVDTGLIQETIRKRHGIEQSRSTQRVFALEMEDLRLLIVEPVRRPPTTVEGALRGPSSDLWRLVQQRIAEGSGLERAYPFVIDTSQFRARAYLQAGALAVLLLCFALWGVPLVRTWRDPMSSALFARLLVWGNARSMSDAVEREHRSPKLSTTQVRIGDRFLMRSSDFTFDVWSVDDLVWAHGIETKKTWYFIPIGRTYAAVFHCYGGTLRFESDQQGVKDALEHVAQKAPWALFGYSPELQKQFNKDPKVVCREVETRKARLGVPGPRKLRLPRGMDARTVLQLTHREAALGARKVVPVSYPLACGPCRGSGVDAQTGGECMKCKGAGEERLESGVPVTVPPGIQAGQTLRVSGKGVPSMDGAKAGDLYIEVRVEPASASP